jgi:transposase
MALSEISTGKNATKVGTATGRNPQTIMEWVHRYNEIGPEAMVFKQTGGHPPPLPKADDRNLGWGTLSSVAGG